MTATKNFRVDSFIASLAVKAPCIVVTNAAITLSGEQTVNSVAVVAGDRVLVKDQVDLSTNGIYEVETSAWSRPGDFDGNRDATNGTLVVVATTPLVGFYQLSATNPVIIGTTDLTFLKVADADLAGLLVLTTTGQGASKIGVEDAAGDYTGADVEAVLAELGAYFDSGDFVASWSDGFTTVPTTTFNYVRVNNLVTLSADVTFTATSNDTIFDSTVGDVPTSLRPAKLQRVLCVVEDNGSDSIGALSIGVTGTLQLSLGVSGGAFTGSGAKGIPQRITMTYALS